MRKVSLFIFISVISVISFSQELEIFGVELPEDPISLALVEYHNAMIHQDVPKMDSLQNLLLPKVESFSDEQKVIWYYESGYYFIEIDFYDKAAKQFSACVRLCEQQELRKMMLYARNAMANIEYAHKNLDGAINAWYDILDDCLEDDWAIEGKIHANIAPLLVEKSSFFTKSPLKKDSLNRLSDEHYRIAMDILEKNKGWLELSRVYAIYSVNMMLKGRLDEAKVYIEKADKLCRLTNNKYRYNFNLIKWSEYYNYQGDFSKAIDSSTKALRYFKKVKNREMQHYVMSVIAYYHEKSNQYDSAYLYAKNLDVLKRSMGLEKMAKQSRQYKVELEVFDKENQIKEQAQKIEFQALENQVSEANRKRWVIGGIGGIAIVILISFIFIQRQKQVAKVEKAQLIIEEREQAFRSVIDGQEAERKRIAQELHDGIGQQLSGVKMALQNMAGTIKEQEESFHQQLNTVIGLVGASSSEVRHLAHQMLPQVLEEKGLSDALKDLIQSTFQASKLKFNYDDRLKNISLTKSAKLTIYRSIQELINNTIKHAEASEIDLYLYESNSNLLVAYSDNGKGINIETAQNGLGLSGIRHRMENLKGSITIDSPNNNGFSAMLKLPLQ